MLTSWTGKISGATVKWLLEGEDSRKYCYSNRFPGFPFFRNLGKCRTCVQGSVFSQLIPPCVKLSWLITRLPVIIKKCYMSIKFWGKKNLWINCTLKNKMLHDNLWFLNYSSRLCCFMSNIGASLHNCAWNLDILKRVIPEILGHTKQNTM